MYLISAAEEYFKMYYEKIFVTCPSTSLAWSISVSGIVLIGSLSLQTKENQHFVIMHLLYTWKKVKEHFKPYF